MPSFFVRHKTLFLAAPAVIHLLFVAASAAHLDLRPDGPFGKFVHLYASGSGAGSSYSFFSPGVGAQLRLRAEGETLDGKPYEWNPEEGHNREMALRVGNIIGGLWDDVADQTTRRAIVASIAGRVFGSDLDLKKVRIVLESYELPTMSEYRDGKRGEWLAYYQATFAYPREPR